MAACHPAPTRGARRTARIGAKCPIEEQAQTFSNEKHAELAEVLAGGASITGAARHVGVGSRTVRRWLAQGPADAGSRFAAFAAGVDGAAERRVVATTRPMTADELRHEVTRAMRAGSVPAMRLYWEAWLRPRSLEPRGT